MVLLNAIQLFENTVHRHLARQMFNYDLLGIRMRVLP